MGTWNVYGKLSSDRLRKDLAKHENNVEFNNLFNLFINMSLDIFEWKNLPPTCNDRMLELNLLYRGMAAIYRDESGVLWTYGAAIGGELTRYGYPDAGFVYALNGINERCKYYWEFMDNTNANAVLCMDNKTSYPYINFVLRAATTISDAKRALQTAARNNKYSYILKCNEEQAKNIKNIYNDVQNNEIAIIISKDNDLTTDVQLFNTNIKNGTLDELWNYYMNIYNDFKDLLGINSNKQADKRERLVVSEVLGDQEFVENNLEFRLEERKKFCERCNEFFGTNISVELKNRKNDKIMSMEGDQDEDDTI